MATTGKSNVEPPDIRHKENRARTAQERRCEPGACGVSQTLPSDRPFTPDHYRQRLRHNGEIPGERTALDVLQIQLYLGPNIVQALIIRMIDLGPPRDAGQDLLSILVAGHLVPKVLEDLGLFGPGADDVHVSLQHIHELGQLVQAIFPENVTDGGDPRIILRGPNLPSPIGVRDHGAELVDPKQSATAVRPPAALTRGGGRSTPPPIQADTLLHVEDRSWRRELHQNGDGEEERGGQDEADQGNRNIEYPDSPYRKGPATTFGEALLGGCPPIILSTAGLHGKGPVPRFLPRATGGCVGGQFSGWKIHADPAVVWTGHDFESQMTTHVSLAKQCARPVHIGGILRKCRF